MLKVLIKTYFKAKNSTIIGKSLYVKKKKHKDNK